MASLPISSMNALFSPSLLFPTPPLSFQFHTKFPPQSKTLNKRQTQFLSLCTSYEVGGGYPESDSVERERASRAHNQEQFNQKLNASQYEAILKGGEQVTSVLKEMITLLEDMSMDAASEEVAVQLAAQGVIGKRVDQMETGFMMALDYMIQTAEKDQDDQRKSLLEVVKETVLSHLTKKCPPHVQVIGLLCRTPKKDSRHELLRRVAAGGGEFKGANGTKVHLPGANLLDIANQADDLLEFEMEKFFNKIARQSIGSSSASANSPLIQDNEKESVQPPSSNEEPISRNPSFSKRNPIDTNALPADPAERKPISSYHPNERDETMETRPVVPDRKLLARLVLIREEARNMMGGGILDERNDRGFNTLPESEVNFLTKLVALKPGKTVQEMIKNVMLGKDEGAENEENWTGGSRGIVGRESLTGRKPLPVRPGMFLETVSKVLGGIYAGKDSGITAQHLEWVHQKTLQILEDIAF